MDTLVRTLAVVASVVVGLSFLLFAVDQLSEGSENQVRALDGASAGRAVSQRDLDAPSPLPTVERVRERRHSAIREAIDDGNDVLVTPFTGLIDSKQIWVERMVPTVLALLLYGLGGMLLANVMPRRHHTVQDWRQPTG